MLTKIWASFALFISLLFTPLTIKEFTTLVKNKIILSTEVIFSSKDFFNENGEYNGPPGTLISILETQILFQAIGLEEKYCLLYQAPSKSRNGTLYLTHENEKTSCNKAWPSWTDPSLVNIQNLRVLTQDAAHFSLHIQMLGRVSQAFDLIFNNVPTMSERRERYASYEFSRPHSGLLLFPLAPDLPPLSIQTYEKSLQAPWRCREKNEKGALAQGDCELCPWSPLPVYNAKYPNILSYDCTPEKCGERGKAGCLLGAAHLEDWEEKDICAEPQEIATCRDGHAPQCANNGDLICP